MLKLISLSILILCSALVFSARSQAQMLIQQPNGDLLVFGQDGSLSRLAPQAGGDVLYFEPGGGIGRWQRLGSGLWWYVPGSVPPLPEPHAPLLVPPPARPRAPSLQDLGRNQQVPLGRWWPQNHILWPPGADAKAHQQEAIRRPFTDAEIEEMAERAAVHWWWEQGGSLQRKDFERYLVPQLGFEEWLRVMKRQCWTNQQRLARDLRCA